MHVYAKLGDLVLNMGENISKLKKFQAAKPASPQLARTNKHIYTYKKIDEKVFPIEPRPK